MKFNLAKSLLLTAFSSVLLFSCKKETPEAETYYLKFRLNGNLVTWTGSGISSIEPDPADNSKTKFALLYSDGNTQNFQNFYIIIQVNGTSLGTGTYGNSDIEMIDYFINENTPQQQWFQLGQASGLPSSNYSVTLTSITDTKIKGNFTGSYLVNNSTGEIATITDGEFVTLRFE